MTKYFQTVIDKGQGNCSQYAIASLFDVDPTEVPNFIEYNVHKFWGLIRQFYIDRGYQPNFVYMGSHVVTDIFEIAKIDGGVNGYFYASVPSQTFKDGTTHAVIVDKNLKVVHDPNPNQLALQLTPADVQFIITASEYEIDMERVSEQPPWTYTATLNKLGSNKKSWDVSISDRGRWIAKIHALQHKTKLQNFHNLKDGRKIFQTHNGFKSWLLDKNNKEILEVETSYYQKALRHAID